MTIEQMKEEIAANVKKVQEIGREKLHAGTVTKELLTRRTQAFSDVVTWYNRGQASRKKEEMNFLYKRSQRMVENFIRL